MELQRGKYSISEVEDYVSANSLNRDRLEVVKVNSSAFNNGTSRDYPFWSNINHPETGELLKATKGYMGVDANGQDRCYYAEYEDLKGNSYCYVYHFPIYNKAGEMLCQRKSIEQQQRDDFAEKENSFRKVQERKNFNDLMKGSNDITSTTDHLKQNISANIKKGHDVLR